ncbi:MAG TPA: S-adenosylmethionine:tRNA ribosyltransferase-isomerase, partial [Anaerolineae bacterium]
PFELHLSTHLPGDVWVVELRQPAAIATKPYYEANPGETFRLPLNARVTLLAPYRLDESIPASKRLWLARLTLPLPRDEYLAQYGFPIRYNYVPRAWPSEYYQTVYATEPGSAEMPSAGRAFTSDLMTRLTAHGIVFAPLVLHTGVASLEAHEPLYEEYYRVPPSTARLVNETHESGKRVIAVGTTVVRALETVTDENGVTNSGEGWTRLVIRADHRMRAVDGMLTGWHEPKATHLAMLESLAGAEPLALAYHEALARGYLWHEFGDLHLILP